MQVIRVPRSENIPKLQMLIRGLPKLKMPKSPGRLISICSAIFLISFGSVIYGFAADRFKLFPYKTFRTFYRFYQNLAVTGSPFVPALHVVSIDDSTREGVTVFDAKQSMPGITFLTGSFETGLGVKLIDAEGGLIQEWQIAWSSLWPDPAHLTKNERPSSDLNTNIHGAALLEDGGIVFNFDHLGLIKLDKCGDVMWRLPYRTHHSVFVAEDGLIWVSAQKNHISGLPNFPNINPPFEEPMVLAISQEGEIVEEISLLSVLAKNGYTGLIYSHSQDNGDTSETGDIFHLNDVEVYPNQTRRTQTPFDPGDILVSMRNINTVFAFDPKTREIVWLRTGEFLRQHDPDFLSDGSVSLFDNNNQGEMGGDTQSRIITFDFAEIVWTVAYEGTADAPFFTDIMGKHQWLENGNLLITESRSARAFEVNPAGEIVWEYLNGFGNGKGGLLMQVDRYDSSLSEPFRRLESCTR